MFGVNVVTLGAKRVRMSERSNVIVPGEHVVAVSSLAIEKCSLIGDLVSP